MDGGIDALEDGGVASCCAPAGWRRESIDYQTNAKNQTKPTVRRMTDLKLKRALKAECINRPPWLKLTRKANRVNPAQSGRIAQRRFAPASWQKLGHFEP